MKIHDIESPKNQIYQDLLTLLSSQGIAKLSQALIFGAKAIEQIRVQYPQDVVGVIIERDMFPVGADGFDRVYKIPQGLFSKLDLFGTKKPILIINVPKIPQITSAMRLEGCSVIIPFQDPSNVGTLLRSAAGFGVNQILLAPGSAHPFHPRSTRAASGIILKHKYFKFTDIKDLSLPLIALDSDGLDLKKFKFPKDFILMPGVEGQGLSGELKNISSSKISIPLIEGVDSLNASIATSIALYSWRTQNS